MRFGSRHYFTLWALIKFYSSFWKSKNSSLSSFHSLAPKTGTRQYNDRRTFLNNSWKCCFKYTKSGHLKKISSCTKSNFNKCLYRTFSDSVIETKMYLMYKFCFFLPEDESQHCYGHFCVIYSKVTCDYLVYRYRRQRQEVEKCRKWCNDVKPF